ncbi:MAG TPA: glycine betaine ABC transporter substrate-binding protein [Solirubrobacterales bacterium]
MTILLCGAAAGCGGAGAKENGEVTITVTSRSYPEEEVLREIYVQALEGAGFDVRRRELDGQLAPEALEAGRVSGYPDHLETALTEAMLAEAEEVPASTTAAYREARRLFGEMGLVPFPPAPFVRTKAIGVLTSTAKERDIETLSDLKGPSRQMLVIERELYCHGRANCLGGLERTYGIVFKEFFGISLREPSSLLYKALRGGEADAVMLITTEGQLARNRKWLVLLEDDERRLPAANAFWMTSQDVIDEAGPDYEKAILDAQKGLTLEVMRELDAAVELEGKPPAKVAAEYLSGSPRTG